MGNKFKDVEFERLHRIYKDAPIGLCYIDRNLRYVYINEWLAKINGIRPEEHVGRKLREVIPEIATGVEHQFLQVIETGEPIIGGTVEAETPAHPGAKRFFQHNYYPVRSDDGRIVGISCVVEDVTERRNADHALRRAWEELELRVQERTIELQKTNENLQLQIAERRKADEELRSSEQYIRGILDNAPDGIATIDARGRIESFNSAAEHLFGFAVEEVLGENISMLMPEPDRSKHGGYIGNYLDTGEGKILGVGPREVIARRKDGSTFPMELSVGEMKLSGRAVFIGAMRDITNLKHIEVRLRRLSGHLINAQEQERQRIARELHDDFSQRLALIAVELDLLGQAFPKISQDWIERLKDIRGQANELSTDIHRMSHQLHPSILEQLGLVSALRILCRDYSRQRNIQIEFDHSNMPETIPSDVAICLYRITQESLRNVVKHSQARVARAEITASSGEIRLCISDAGVGFDPRKIVGKRGLGLVSMEERLRLVGGKISIYAETNRGTRIEVRVPLFPETA